MQRLFPIVFILTLFLLPTAARTQDSSSTASDIEEIRGDIQGIKESAAEYRTIIDALRKIKVSGYVQAQARFTDLNGASTPFSGGAFPGNANKVFQVRRGRVKVVYDNALTQFALQIDAIPTGVSLKDAYVQLTEPWLRSFGFQMGVFDRPFGYEISFSSSMRETPERARVTQTLFPGERELGAKLIYAPQSGRFAGFHADLGVVNGSGPAANEYDNFKDLIGRVGYQLAFEEANIGIDFDVSGYFGKVRNATKFLWTPGSPAPGLNGMVLDSSAANLGAGVTRRYLGADAQVYLDVPMLGGLVLRGEVVAGEQPGTSDTTRGAGGEVRPTGKSLTSVSPTAQALGPVYRRNVLGWYVYAVQNIGSSDQLVFKYDVFDPNTDAAPGDFVAGSNLTAADLAFRTLGIGFVHHWDENVKFMLYYEIVRNETVSPAAGLAAYTNDIRDNVLTFRTQVKF